MDGIAISLSLADVAGLAIVGAIVSFVLQYIKNKWGANGNATKLAAIVASLIIGCFYWFVRDTAVWVNFVGILTVASTVFALLIKNTGAEKFGK